MRRWEATSRQAAVLVGGAAVLTGGYLALPVDAVRSAVWLVAGLATAAAVLTVTHREGVEDRVPGWLLAAGLSLLTLGQAIEVSGQSSGSPSYADPPRLLAYAVLAAAVTAFQRDRIRHDRDSLLDALVVTVAAAQAGWLVLIDPLVHADQSDGALSHADERRLPARPPARARRRDPARLRRGRRLATVPPGCCWPACSPASRPAWPPTSPTGPSSPPAGSSAWPWSSRPSRTRRWPTRSRCVASARLTTTWRFVVLLGLACLVSPVMVVTHPVGDGVTKTAVVLGGAAMLFTLAVLRIVSLLVPAAPHPASRARAAHRHRRPRGRGGPGRHPRRRAHRRHRHAGPARATRLADRRRPGRHRSPRPPRTLELATFLDSAELSAFPEHDEGIGILAGPSLLHATLGVPVVLDARAGRAAGARRRPRGAASSSSSGRRAAHGRRAGVARLDDEPGARAARRRRDHGRAPQRAPAPADAAVRLGRDLHPRPRPDDRARDAGRGADRRAARARAARHELARGRRRGGPRRRPRPRQPGPGRPPGARRDPAHQRGRPHAATSTPSSPR